jgi:hypothetical protein
LFLRGRFPSARETYLLFAACTFPVHIWALLNLFRKVPAYILRLSAQELVGVSAYTLAFALLESLILLIFLIALSATLPSKYFRDRFVAQGAILVLLISSWLIPVHYQRSILVALGVNPTQFLALIFLWVISFAILLSALSYLIRRSSAVESTIVKFVDRLTVLAGLYLLLDVTSVFTIIIRNLQLPSR